MPPAACAVGTWTALIAAAGAAQAARSSSTSANPATPGPQVWSRVRGQQRTVREVNLVKKSTSVQMIEKDVFPPGQRFHKYFQHVGNKGF